MPVEENKAIVRRWFEQAWSQGNMDVMDELIHADHTYHDHTAPHRHHPDYDPSMSDAFHGPEGQKTLISAYRNAFPDMQFTTEQEIAEGDFVVITSSGHGTHQGEFMGIPPTGKPVEVQGITVLRVGDGKIQQHWVVWNSLAVLHQLGARILPPQQEGGS